MAYKEPEEYGDIMEMYDDQEEFFLGDLDIASEELDDQEEGRYNYHNSYMEDDSDLGTQDDF